MKEPFPGWTLMAQGPATPGTAPPTFLGQNYCAAM